MDLNHFDYGGGVFPLVKFRCFRIFGVDYVDDSLLILPISDLVGLISRQVCLLVKFGLWSLSTLSSIPSFIAMILLSA